MKNRLQILIAELWADWLGVELNKDKREPVLTRTRHLGYFVDLSEKMLSVTNKHSRKIIDYFNRFLMIVRKQDRIRIKEIQKMLGLQIWISAVFRVAR